MVSASNFVIRASGRKDNCFYIDYQGSYKISDIALIVGLKAELVKDKYIEFSAVYDQELDVYYFPNPDKAQQSLKSILAIIKPDRIGRAIYLTDQEIEFVRQALINECNNTLKLKNNVKDSIFKKLNEL